MKIRIYTISTLAAPTNPRTARQSGEKQERFLVRLNPETGELLFFEAMKYQKSNGQMLWNNSIWSD